MTLKIMVYPTEQSLSSRIVADTTFGLNEWENRQKIVQRVRHGKWPLIRMVHNRMRLVHRSSQTQGEYALVLNTPMGGPSDLFYYMKYRIVTDPVLRFQVATPVGTWRDRESTLSKLSDGIVSEVFWTCLFPKTHALVCDEELTEAGKFMWTREVGAALYGTTPWHVQVMMLDHATKKAFLITDDADYKYALSVLHLHGTEEFHKMRRIALFLTDKPLPEDIRLISGMSDITEGEARRTQTFLAQQADG